LTGTPGSPRRLWAVIAVAGLLVAAGCSGPASSTKTSTTTTTTTSTTTTPSSATTVPGSVADPLTAPVRTRDTLSAPIAPGAPASVIPTVTPPGATFRTPAQVAGLPVAKVGSWQLVARTTDNRFLLVSIPFGGCDSLAGLEVSAAAAAVTITPRLRTAAPGALCPAFIATAHYIVDIGGPLGPRALLHPPPG
jgi:hypothetical protein